MATNQNGHLLDSRGNVVVDFVWGNLPIQPNDVRRDNGGSNLDYTKDNHVIVETAYNGYPLYTPNDDGAIISGTAYVVVPNVLGQLTADAVDTLTDSEFTITTASAATNAAVQPTRVNVTATTAATVYVASGTGAYPVGTKVTIASGTGIPTAVVGTWTVTGGNGTNIVISGTGWTVADSGSITPGTKLSGAAGTIKTQSIAAGTDSVAVGAAITVTPWAAAS
jgi:hypothetical protein